MSHMYALRAPDAVLVVSLPVPLGECLIDPVPLHTIRSPLMVQQQWCKTRLQVLKTCLRKF
eukprot:7785817-Alexandrium_andersonii.AAC.1